MKCISLGYGAPYRVDLWSLALIVEAFVGFTKRSEGTEPQLPEVTKQYREYVEWQSRFWPATR